MADLAGGVLVGRDGISTREADRRVAATSRAKNQSFIELAEEILQEMERRHPPTANPPSRSDGT